MGPSRWMSERRKYVLQRRGLHERKPYSIEYNTSNSTVNPENSNQEQTQTIVLRWRISLYAREEIKRVLHTLIKHSYTPKIDKFTNTNIIKMTVTASMGDPLRELIEEILNPEPKDDKEQKDGR